ncbi:mgtA regulatory leader peptide MgtL [Escherichia coli]|nr:mgtA regulatory leader peptide MgtL [Escherichia coli]
MEPDPTPLPRRRLKLFSVSPSFHGVTGCVRP